MTFHTFKNYYLGLKENHYLGFNHFKNHFLHQLLVQITDRISATSTSNYSLHIILLPISHLSPSIDLLNLPLDWCEPHVSPPI